jgi:GAF domain-containing protein
MNAPLPPDETGRLAALRRYEVLDTPPEEAFDDLTRLAAHICQTPIALICLIDETRQWFKSKVGLAATETPRNTSICAHAILHGDAGLQLSDTERDPRFAANPLVTGDPHVRSYAGIPLLSPEGHALGVLSVCDHVPRTLTPEQFAALRALSRNVVARPANSPGKPPSAAAPNPLSGSNSKNCPPAKPRRTGSSRWPTSRAAPS